MHEENQRHDEYSRVQYVILFVALAKVVTLLIERFLHDLFVKGITCFQPLQLVWTRKGSFFHKSETLEFERNRLPIEL